MSNLYLVVATSTSIPEVSILKVSLSYKPISNIVKIKFQKNSSVQPHNTEFFKVNLL